MNAIPALAPALLVPSLYSTERAIRIESSEASKAQPIT
jgi:hypothetical protein